MEIESECERILGELALEAGDVNGASERFGRSLEVCRAAEDKRGEATALWWQGKADVAARKSELAWIRLSGALRAFQAFEMYAEILGCLDDIADLLHMCALRGEAACVYAVIERFRSRLALSQSPRFEIRRKARIDALRRALSEAGFDTACAKGSAWSIEQTIRYALSSAMPQAVAA